MKITTPDDVIPPLDWTGGGELETERGLGTAIKERRLPQSVAVQLSSSYANSDRDLCGSLQTAKTFRMEINPQLEFAFNRLQSVDAASSFYY